MLRMNNQTSPVTSRSRTSTIDTSGERSRGSTVDSGDDVTKSLNPLTAAISSTAGSFVAERTLSEEMELRPARRRVVSMDSEADERAPRRDRKPRRQMDDISEIDCESRGRGRRNSMSGSNSGNKATIVKGMDPFVSMLPRGHRVLKYRGIFAKLDLSKLGNLTLPQIEEGLRMLGFDTTNMDVRATVGAHVEAVANACGVSQEDISNYFEAQVSSFDHHVKSSPSPPKYLVFSSLHFTALCEELRIKIRPQSAQISSSSHHTGGGKKPLSFNHHLKPTSRDGDSNLGIGGAHRRKKGVSLTDLTSEDDRNARFSDGDVVHRRFGMKRDSSANLTRGSLRWAGSFMNNSVNDNNSDQLLYKLSVRLVRVRGLKSRHVKAKAMRWISTLFTNPLKLFRSKEQNEAIEMKEKKDQLEKMARYKKLRQNKPMSQVHASNSNLIINEEDDDDDDDALTFNDDDTLLLKKTEKMKLKKMKEKEINDLLLKKRKQEAICNDVTNYDQFEVGVLLLGLESSENNDEDDENNRKVLPVSTLKSPYFDGEENPDDVMFARHVEFNDVQQSPSSIFSSPSIGLEFRYTHHTLNNPSLSVKSPNRNSINQGNTHHLRHHHHPHHPHHNDHHPKKRSNFAQYKTKGSKNSDDESVEDYEEDEYPESQRLLGWCDVSLQKAMERHTSRHNRKQRKREVREEKREQKQKLLRLQQRAKGNRMARQSINEGDGFENMGGLVRGNEQEEQELKELEAGLQAAKLLEEEAAKEDEEDEDSSSDSEGEKKEGNPWDALKWYPISDADGNQVGEAYIGVRFDAVDLEEDQTSTENTSKLTQVEQLLFKMYDTDGDGLLSPTEFSTLVHDLRQVHGDIDAIAGRTSHPGCLGKVVGLPDSDLLSFIKYNHTLSNLVAVNQPGQHWSEDMGGVEINRFGMCMVLALTLLYSFTVNALVEITFWHISTRQFLESGFKPTVSPLPFASRF